MTLTFSKKQSHKKIKIMPMNWLVKNFIATIIAITIPLTTFASNKNDFVANANLPTDAKKTCEANVSSWFPGGHIIANGWVEPANSLDPIFANFKKNTRCDFYKWGAQMFLWLTSGNRTQHVFNSPPEFYNVSVAVDGKRTFLSERGPLVMTVRKGKTDDEIELGQAGGGDTLLSQKESLVYYSLHANDIFALYTTGKKTTSKAAKKLPDHFPSTPEEVTSVDEFAKQYGYTIWNNKPMAMELKTSWVDATTVNNKNDYVLTQTVVPIFDRSTKDPVTGKQQWTITGEQEKTLAMVGLHVVGSVNGHPEMVWSTFEHVNNAPDNIYTYTTTSNKPQKVPYRSLGTWNFIKSNAPAPTSITANAKVSTYTGDGAECKRASPSDKNSECIVNVNGANIAPIDILRVDPWGDDQSNPATAIDNNTDLVSINVSVLSQLKAGDIRGNYIQTGGIWTAEGQIPTGGEDSSLRGSLNLANTTMETFYQFHNSSPGAFNPKNCFGCHSSTPTQAPEVSHIFDQLQALPKK